MGLLIAPDFGWWFSGFFDGEGSFILHTERRESSVQHALKIQVMVRDDDFALLEEVHRKLGCGCLHRNARRVQANPHALFRVQDTRELAETIVPLFEAYPLRSKKSREFPIWRDLVLMRYSEVNRGQRHYTDSYIKSFEAARERITTIRTYQVSTNTGSRI